MTVNKHPINYKPEVQENITEQVTNKWKIHI